LTARALDAIVNAGYRQAALISANTLGTQPEHFWVDQHHRLIAFFGHVDDDQPFVNIHLCCRQADAIGFVHGFQHVADQAANAVIHRLDRLGDGVQARVWVTEDGEQSHAAIVPVLPVNFAHLPQALPDSGGVTLSVGDTSRLACGFIRESA
jgi:hypothetical protein